MNYNIGINFAGFFDSKIGLGEAARGNHRALLAAGIPVSIYNFNKTLNDDVRESSYPVNIVQINPDNLPIFLSGKGAIFLKNKFNIAYWAWETSEFPDTYKPFFSFFNEIWVPSRYCMEVISKKSPIPVVCVPHCIDINNWGLEEEPLSDIPELEIRKGTFIFMFSFDFNSQMFRKNPLAVIEAFRTAFGSNNPNVTLLIKISSSKYHQEDYVQFQKQAANDNSIIIYEKTLEREAFAQLLNRCDCYISLHHSEGFGLGMAEAMALGKPVIATAYSGNMQFMNINNSFLVKYKLTEIKENKGPFEKGSFWADPDVHHASELMKEVYSNKAKRTLVAEQGRVDILQHFSVTAVAKHIKNRLEVINKHLSAISANSLNKELGNLKIENMVLQEKVNALKNISFVKLKLKFKNLKNKLTGQKKKYIWE